MAPSRTVGYSMQAFVFLILTQVPNATPTLPQPEDLSDNPTVLQVPIELSEQHLVELYRRQPPQPRRAVTGAEAVTLS